LQALFTGIPELNEELPSGAMSFQPAMYDGEFVPLLAFECDLTAAIAITTATTIRIAKIFLPVFDFRLPICGWEPA